MKYLKPDKTTILGVILGVQCVVAAALPLLETNGGPPPARTAPDAWPASFEGASLEPVALGARAEAALNRFPGQVALFTDGSRYILFRNVTRPTRQLHSSADCLRGMGHRTRSRTVITRDDGDRWARFTTDRGIEAFEQIRAQRSRKTWTDVSAWYWHATFHRDDGPWLAVTILSSDFRE